MNPAVEPLDAHNRELLAQVHPSDWVNPAPASRYNLVVIGAGTAGLVTAAGAAGLGAKVALVEKHLMGGDCLNVGCVPSKTLLHAAREGMEFSAAMERVRRIRAEISPHDSAKRFAGLGVDVFFGDARFMDSDTVDVAGKQLRFKRAVLATGARAAIPPIPGLAEAGYLTNETVFNLTSLPKRLAVIGGGPIGCELAQAFRRFGTEVTILHKHGHLLERDDPEAAAILQARFGRDGIRLALGAKIDHIETSAFAEASADTSKDWKKISGNFQGLEVDAILVAAGRAPNVKGMGLETVGVKFDERRGVDVDDHLRTSNPRIFACGDVCMAAKFTHAADFAARIVIQNALFRGRKKLSALTIPWCTYTDPEIAQVGVCEGTVYVRHFKDVDRARTDGDEEGFVKIWVRPGTDRIAGATVVGSRAGDLVSEISVAMAGGVGLGRLASVIHPYPTRAEAIRQLGDAYNRTRLTPLVKALFRRWLTWTR